MSGVKQVDDVIAFAFWRKAASARRSRGQLGEEHAGLSSGAALRPESAPVIRVAGLVAPSP